MISWMYNKSGYPIGGSLELAKSIEKRYLSLRGKINYNSKVVKIITENNIATGIKLENGNTHAADIIISAADGHYTIFEMLEGKYVNQEISDMYNNMELFPSIIQISLGIVDSLKDYPCHLIFPLDSPIVIDDKNNLGILGIKIFNYDPTLAPKGKVTVTTFFEADYEYWVRLREENKEKYNAEKERIAKEVISAIDKKIPGISSKVDVYDIATPATYIRYTNIWKGSYEGWIPKAKALMARIKYTLPGLDNFYMVGQWVQPGGGIPSGAITGRNVTQIICKKDNKKFMTTIT
jgi:phytoene dehydrogenase-like protein